MPDIEFSETDFGWGATNVAERIKAAIDFHNSCEHMGEQLCCFPESITSLCSLFSFVGEDKMRIWDSLDQTAFTEKNLSKWRGDAKRRTAQEKPTRIQLSKNANGETA